MKSILTVCIGLGNGIIAGIAFGANWIAAVTFMVFATLLQTALTMWLAHRRG
jgi:hypothetical protein